MKVYIVIINASMYQRCSVMVATNKKFVRECLEPEFRSAVRASNWTYADMCTSSIVDAAQQSSMCTENIRAQNVAIRHSELLTKMATEALRELS